LKYSSWIIDSGASSHMSSEKKFFADFKPCKKKIFLADGKVINCTGIGSGVFMGVNEKKEPVKVNISDVLYVPQLQGNLLSVNFLVKKGFKVEFAEEGCQILKENQTIVVGKAKTTGIYQLKKFKQCDKIIPNRHESFNDSKPEFSEKIQEENGEWIKVLPKKKNSKESGKKVVFSAIDFSKFGRRYQQLNGRRQDNKK
jgi:hypothetical protein